MQLDLMGQRKCRGLGQQTRAQSFYPPDTPGYVMAREPCVAEGQHPVSTPGPFPPTNTGGCGFRVGSSQDQIRSNATYSAA
jgi:hypothetical protein